MTEWALIIMLCSRFCTPQYVVMFPTKAACEAKITKPESNWSRAEQFCVPVVKEKP